MGHPFFQGRERADGRFGGLGPFPVMEVLPVPKESKQREEGRRAWGVTRV